MNDRMTANESCYCVQGNCIDRADNAGCSGKGVTGGVSYTLNTIDRHAVCYAVEGNVVDRNAGQNGKGWCEGVAPSLSTQDRHAICFRKVSKPGAGDKGERWEESDTSNTLNGFEFHSDVRTPEIICFAPNGNHCGVYLPTDVCATLETKYHYGSGGDAALVLRRIK